MIYSLRFFTACCYFGSFIVIYLGDFIVSYFGSFIVRSVRAVSGVVGPWGLWLCPLGGTSYLQLNSISQITQTNKMSTNIIELLYISQLTPLPCPDAQETWVRSQKLHEFYNLRHAGCMSSISCVTQVAWVVLRSRAVCHCRKFSENLLCHYSTSFPKYTTHPWLRSVSFF